MQQLNRSRVHNHTVRIYWEDTDAGGVVYYANYLKFMERARTEWFRSLRVQQSILKATHDVVFVASQVDIRYLHAAQLDDELVVHSTLTACKGASVIFQQHINQGDRRICEATTRLGCVKYSTQPPCRIPPSLLTQMGLL